MPDYPNLLNNLLQGQKLSHLLRYTFEQEGPDDNAIHVATVVFRDRSYGVGRGTSKGAAKQGAAQLTYEQFTTTGIPEA